MLQLSSRLLLRSRLEELASVTMDSLSRSRSRSLSRSILLWPAKLGDNDKCVLGAIDVSAVDATPDVLSWCVSLLNKEGECVVEVCDMTSFTGVVLTLSDCTDADSSSLAGSVARFAPLLFPVCLVSSC